jgi:hypothetical protein
MSMNFVGIRPAHWRRKKGNLAISLSMKRLPAKAGGFLLRLKVMYFKPQNR